MEILKNSNNYYGLVSDYKDGYEFKDTIREQHNARGKLAITEMVHMVPTENDWKQVRVSCETSDVFYHAVETEIPVVEEVVVEIEVPLNQNEQIIKNVVDEEEVPPYVEGTEHFEFHDNDGTEDNDENDMAEDDSLFR